ncbi:hypothetical protein JCM10212_000893 [Sporobolomyces blumeae]
MAATFSLFSPSEQSYASVPLASTSSSPSTSPFDAPLRPDGRLPLEYRDIVLQTGVSQAQGCLGSSKVTVEDAAGTAGGSVTEILAGVRGEIESIASAGPGANASSAPPSADEGEGGRIVVTLECAPTSLPSLKPELPLQLASLLSSLFSAANLPRSLVSQLVVLPRSKAWTLYLDVLVLSSAGGNVTDLAVVAARAALANVRIPQTRAIGFGTDDGVDDATTAQGGGASATELLGGTGATQDEGFSGLVKGGKAGSKAVDFELVDGGERGVRLEGWQDLPVSITFNLINQLPHLDSTALESSASPSSLTISTLPSSGRVCGLAQSGEGEIEFARIQGLVREGVRYGNESAKSLNVKLRDA